MLSDDETPRDWIRRHHVCWESLPHREWSRGRIRVVGYDVRLAAKCIGPGPWDPGGRQCQALFEELQRVARCAVPATCREAVGFGTFEPAFHLRPEAGFELEVHLVIEVRHRGCDYFDAADADENDSRRRIEEALARLGAQHGTWRDPATPPTRIPAAA